MWTYLLNYISVSIGDIYSYLYRCDSHLYFYYYVYIFKIFLLQSYTKNV